MVAQYKVAKDAGVQVSGMFIPDWSGSVSSPAGTHALRDWTWDTGYYPGTCRWGLYWGYTVWRTILSMHLGGDHAVSFCIRLVLYALYHTMKEIILFACIQEHI